MTAIAILEPKAEARVQRQINEGRFTQAEIVRNVHVAVPEAGTKFEDLLDPLYWSHVARQMRPTDKIEIHPEDGTYYAVLLVRSVNPRAAIVVEILKKDFDQMADAGLSDDFTVQWRGPHDKHAVMRVRDKTVLQKGFGTREDAAAWLASNLKTLAA